MSLRRDHESPVRITTAPTSRADDIRHRQRRYLVSMAIRTLCVIGAVVVGPGWLRWVLVAGAVFLPYVAVVMANATGNKDDGFALRTTPATHQLEGPAPDRRSGGEDTPHAG